MLKNQGNTKKPIFILIGWTYTQADIKQIAEMNTPHINFGKTVSLTFTKASSMLPEILHKVLFILWKIKETLWKPLSSFI